MLSISLIFIKNTRQPPKISFLEQCYSLLFCSICVTNEDEFCKIVHKGLVFAFESDLITNTFDHSPSPINEKMPVSRSTLSFLQTCAAYMFRMLTITDGVGEKLIFLYKGQILKSEFTPDLAEIVKSLTTHLCPVYEKKSSLSIRIAFLAKVQHNKTGYSLILLILTI